MGQTSAGSVQLLHGAQWEPRDLVSCSFLHREDKHRMVWPTLENRLALGPLEPQRWFLMTCGGYATTYGQYARASPLFALTSHYIALGVCIQTAIEVQGAAVLPVPLSNITCTPTFHPFPCPLQAQAFVAVCCKFCLLLPCFSAVP